MNLSTLRSRYRDAILALAEKHKAENVRVFGSVVHGEARDDSDVDILVHMKEGASLLDLVALNNRVTDLIGVPADVLSDDGIREPYRERILGEAVPL